MPLSFARAVRQSGSSGSAGGIRPEKYLKWQKRVYSYLAVPAVLYASMVGVIRGQLEGSPGAHERRREKRPD